MKWQVTAKLIKFQDEMAYTKAPLHSECHKTKLNLLPILLTSWLVISIKVAVYRNQPTRGHLTGLRNKPQKSSLLGTHITTLIHCYYFYVAFVLIPIVKANPVR